MTPFDLRLLTVFMAVVEAEGFSAAQVALNLSGPAISRAMADLEARLGVTLCQRGRGGFRLTEEGRRAYDAARRLKGSMEQFKADVGALKGGLVGELTVAAIDNWIFDARCPLTPALRELKLRGAEMTVSLHSVAPDVIERMVLEERVRIGLGVFHHRKPGLRYAALYEDPIELYCGAGHPAFAAAIEGREALPLDAVDYAQRGYVAEERVSDVTSAFRSSARGHQIESIAYLILTGHFVGYLPASWAAPWVAAGQMASIAPGRYKRTTTLEVVTRRGAKSTALEDAFLDLVREHSAKVEVAGRDKAPPPLE
jgi:DNA-binding transcriptional LysR family regulator